MIRVIRALAMALCALASGLALGGGESLLHAAKRFRSDASWQENSIIKADINCDGKSEYIILGHTKSKTIVAAFRGNSSRTPDSIAFSADRINSESAAITLESLDIGDEAFKAMLGGVPEGYMRSKGCKGIGLSDGNRDTIHIYWSGNEGSWRHGPYKAKERRNAVQPIVPADRLRRPLNSNVGPQRKPISRRCPCVDRSDEIHCTISTAVVSVKSCKPVADAHSYDYRFF